MVGFGGVSYGERNKLKEERDALLGVCATGEECGDWFKIYNDGCTFVNEKGERCKCWVFEALTANKDRTEWKEPDAGKI